MPPTSSPKGSTSASREKRTRNALASSEKTSSFQKPHKGNSEARKLQNRIASKNYREKRKRKLEYLQQLLKSRSSHGQSPAVSPSESMDDCFGRPHSLSGEQCTLAHEPDPVSTHPSEQGPPTLVSSSATSGLVGVGSAFELVSVCQGSFEDLGPMWPSPPLISSSNQGSDSITAFDRTWFPEISDFTNDGDFQFQPSPPFQQPPGQISELPIHTIGMASSDPPLPTIMGQSSAFTARSQSFSNVGASDPRGREVQDSFKRLSG
ncbi:uncharacterized protein K441DRAFT_672820 [Cenococcum geophilum 1.58]|uniref:uncharacterized protein n=1 Tax=Cenococcum geophilum 1.58 TaxID=794803 RepID=UPI00359007F5|nr:hypothetical protein K441DRAFT_672820 [Cenococcum geophilum 1.58]